MKQKNYIYLVPTSKPQNYYEYTGTPDEVIKPSHEDLVHQPTNVNNENVNMTVEEIIDVLVEEHNAEITKGEFYYSVTIWDATAGCYQDLELTEDELVDLYKTYFA